VIHAPVALLTVWYESEERLRVGRLATRERRILFEYDPAFVASGIEISPFDLPLKPGVVESRRDLFNGLFGVSADSLPDGWGRLLLDRTVERHGIGRGQLGPLDRLAFVGRHGMGALSYEPDYSGELAGETGQGGRKKGKGTARGKKDDPDSSISLDRIAEEARIVLAGDSEEIFDELLRLNGSSGGARPKIVAQVSPDRKRIIGGELLEPDYEPWMIKFASSQDERDGGAIEYAYSLMAAAAGVEVPPTHLFRTRRGGYFGTRRFDREGDRRIHMHSLAGLIGADYRHPSLDYDTYLKTAMVLTRNIVEVEKAYALACFNVLAHNRDDHARNFSFLLREGKQWVLARAYDLTFSHGPNGEQSMLLLGEGRAPGVEGLTELGRKHSIKRAQQILERVQAAVARWLEFSEQAGVGKKSATRIEKHWEQNHRGKVSEQQGDLGSSRTFYAGAEPGRLWPVSPAWSWWRRADTAQIPRRPNFMAPQEAAPLPVYSGRVRGRRWCRVRCISTRLAIVSFGSIRIG
jgi:serine/threonine-protein kinase HipA